MNPNASVPSEIRSENIDMKA